ncbi:DUF3142 domain-containing protein [Cerasicoccus fimbriatus]|uniref:DUF3142 domain-containing protein n=1 Tax=Cerasicoccus fimbriatus TaxID=3014554 RepID=UPI0022B35E9A|nr:DUF3142 domain-containing protein [Cerasicoccus sp. TK19100]
MPPLALVFLSFFILLATTTITANPQPSSAYIWQRDWKPSVRQAIEDNQHQVDGFTVLAAEITPSSAGAKVDRVAYDAHALVASQKPITLAIRVGQYPGPFTSEANVTQTLLRVTQDTLESARARGIEPAAVEIDFDCATSKLAGYESWLRQLRPVLGETPLSITTLPTWMSAPSAFQSLVNATDHYVLQVHSIQRPTLHRKATKLCDAEQSLRWAQQASAFGRSFSIALPTYGYQLVYDASGALVEVNAEDATAARAPQYTYQEVRANPVEMASLVRAMQGTPPNHCQGIIWYRLPVGDERLNWDQATWHTVMQGAVAPAQWQVQAIPQADGLTEIQLSHRSSASSEPPARIELHWKDAEAITWDGQRNFTVSQPSANSLTWSRPPTCPTLAQGERWTLGWVRFDHAPTVQFSIIQ